MELCHDPFPELSHIVIPTSSPLGLLHLPLLGLPNLHRSVPITPNQVPGASPSRIQSHSQNPDQNAPPWTWGYGCLPRSHDDCTPLSSPRTPQPLLIRSDDTQPDPLVLLPSHLMLQPELWSDSSPSASGMQIPSGITWMAHENCTTTCHPCHLISRPLSQFTWDLRVPTLFSF